MSVTVVCRPQGELEWTHIFRVPEWLWRSFLRHARRNRHLEYAVQRNGVYTRVGAEVE